MKILNKSFYQRDTALVAQELLGKIIVRVIDKKTILKVMIVETEAYMGLHDPASHAFGGKRVRNVPLYGPVGPCICLFYLWYVLLPKLCFSCARNSGRWSAHSCR